MPRRCSGTAGGNRRRASGNKLNLPHGQFLATAALSGTGHSHQPGTGQMTASAALSSSGGMLGKLGTGATAASAALTGTGSVVAGTYSFRYPGTAGPTNAASYGSIAAWTLQFEVTSGGHELLGYAFWVCPGSPAGETAAQDFVLYTWTGATFAIALTSHVTSGTLSTGWNEVLLGTPYSLTASTNYLASTWVNGNFTEVNNLFGSGQTYAAGFTNGPLFIYSDTSGSAAAPSGYHQCAFCTSSGNYPTLPCNTNSNQSWWGLDVVVQ